MVERGKATIIGARGFIGQALLQRLDAQGWECRAPGRAELALPLRGAGHVFYCAGLTADFQRRPLDTIEAHSCLISRLLAGGGYQSLVYLSSTRLYDSAQGEATEDQPLRLNPNTPRHLYDISKALGEAACLALGDGRAKVARLSCVFRDQHDADGFLPALMRDALRQRAERPRQALAVDSSPHFSRDYVHLDDVLDALERIATGGRELIYNVAGGRNLSNAELFTEVGRLSGMTIVPTKNDPCPEPPAVSVLRMEREFGWHPASALEKVREVFSE